jgi:hypothetical protein
MPTSLCDQGIFCFYAEAMAGDRQEQVRLRLSESDLAKVSAIQDHLNSIGSLASLGKVVSNAIDAYYSILVAEGSVPPNL